jgi:hypothetical protein
MVNDLKSSSSSRCSSNAGSSPAALTPQQAADLRFWRWMFALMLLASALSFAVAAYLNSL